MNLVYLVEDDDNIRELVCYTLDNSGFKAAGFACAADFLSALSDTVPDIILLDIMLPDKDGLSILKTLKNTAHTQKIPVIMLTAKSTEMDKIRGLDSGADDYITKPFSVMELMSRIRAVLRRTDDKSGLIVYNDITINLNSRQVFVDGKLISLTYKELELLCVLVRNRSVVLTRDRLLNDVWGYEFEGETRTVDVHIRTLRQKLGKSGGIIETVRNVGYVVM